MVFALNNPIKKFLFPNPELETQLAEASNALCGEFRRLHAARNALYVQIRDIENAPPSRSDLAAFLSEFIDGALSAGPNWGREKLLRRLEGVKNSGCDPSPVLLSWLNGFRSGLDDYDDVFLSLLGDTLKANADRLAATLPWPDGGLPAVDRIKKVAELRAQAEGLAAQADAVAARAQRLNVTLTTE